MRCPITKLTIGKSLRYNAQMLQYNIKPVLFRQLRDDVIKVKVICAYTASARVSFVCIPVKRYALFEKESIDGRLILSTNRATATQKLYNPILPKRQALDTDYDYVVVGSGPGGGPTAANLAVAGYKGFASRMPIAVRLDGSNDS
jgi:hypothetical protein